MNYHLVELHKLLLFDLSGEYLIMISKGFTLVELLVVIAIIGILAAIGIPAYQGFTTSAKINSAEASIKIMQRFISAEIAKCNQGIDLPGGTYGTLSWSTLACSTNRNSLTAYNFHLYFDNYIESVFKNTWNQNARDWVIGGAITGGSSKYGYAEVMPANSNGSTNNNGTHLRLSINVGHKNGLNDVIRTVLIPLND
jgi:type IV pilus assembly protein PilA